MDCPRCSGLELEELSSEYGATVFRCAECGSVWMDSGDVTRTLLHHDLPGIDAVGGRENLAEAAGTCPEDLTDLVVIEAPKSDALSYAICEVCGGIWLGQRADGEPFGGDTGDEVLEQVVAFFRAFGQARS